MTSKEAFEYLDQLNSGGIHPGLTDIKAVLDACGNPQKKGKYIQITGTNGKGSTALMISNILREAGYRVGVYASPAVFDPLEIISVNGRNISKADHARLTEKIAAVIKTNNLPATRFEFETVMAFLFFEERECDVVVLEAGMGGELDATNVVESNIAAVFTPIGMDHAAYLGNTVEKIAATKAGIMKAGGMAVSAVQTKEVMDVLKDRAANIGDILHVVEEDRIKNVSSKLNGNRFDYKDYKKLEIGLAGRFQVMNACTAIEAVLAINDYLDRNVSENNIRNGLHKSMNHGRFEVCAGKPTFIFDGAHNEPAAIRLRESLELLCGGKRLIYILSMLKDKDIDKFVSITVPPASHVITVTSPNRARALPSVELAKYVSEYHNMITTADSIEEAVELAKMMADKDTVVVVTGSLSHLMAVKKCIKMKPINKV